MKQKTKIDWLAKESIKHYKENMLDAIVKIMLQGKLSFEKVVFLTTRTNIGELAISFNISRGLLYEISKEFGGEV